MSALGQKRIANQSAFRRSRCVVVSVSVPALGVYQGPRKRFASLPRNTNTLRSASLTLRYGRALIRGVAPHMRDQAAFLTLGGGAGGRALGSVFLVAICDQHATPACPHSLGAAGG